MTTTALIAVIRQQAEEHQEEADRLRSKVSPPRSPKEDQQAEIQGALAVSFGTLAEKLEELES